nr:cation:proton antiporter [Granulicella sp. dw_53]
MVVILVATGVCGALVTRVGQPRVVGEIAGGLLLGPLVLGHMFPVAFGFLFAPSSFALLEGVSTVGLGLFLFLMGAELDFSALRQSRGAVLAVTAGSVGVPFALGAGLAVVLFGRFGVGHAERLGFVLFVGIAMSITAMPVLARILEDRRQMGQAIDATVGTLAMVCAAANDLLGWCLLVFTLSLRRGAVAGTFAGRIGLLLVYLGVMFLVVRPLAAKVFAGRRPPTWLWVPVMVAIAFVSARATDALGVHAFFGAFAAGLCVPRVEHEVGGRDEPLEAILRRLFQPVLWLALPVFFTMTGLKMQREIFSGEGLGWLGIILLAAVAGKIGGASLGARAAGMPWKAAAQVGVLLNTRGLVELIVLNIGYKEGILSPMLFTLFILMAVITTVMTAPLFDLTYKLWAARTASGLETGSSR